MLCSGLERDETALVKATLPPLAPHSTNANFASAAQADFPGALAYHSSVWQEEGTSREAVHYSVHQVCIMQPKNCGSWRGRPLL